MIRKLIFLALYVPLHSFLTGFLLQNYLFNYNPNVDTGLWARLCHVMAFLLSVPVMLPFIVTDMGEHWPMWVQALPWLFNSLIWGVVILLLISGASIFLRSRRTRQDDTSPATGRCGGRLTAAGEGHVRQEKK